MPNLHALNFSRGDKTRTCDPLVPNQVRYQLRHAPIDGAKLAFFFKLTNTHARQYDFLAVQTKCKPSTVLVGFNSNDETHKDLPWLCRGS